MGYGRDEDLLEDDDCRESTSDERLAMKVFDYDYDSFFSLCINEQHRTIQLAKRMNRTKRKR